MAGDAAGIAKIQPLLDALGQKTWPLGDDPRRANIAKIAGNLMITLAIEAMGEASALAERYGVKAKDFLDIVTSTLFAAPSCRRYGGFIASRTYEPGFRLTLGLKDVNLAVDAAKAKDAVLRPRSWCERPCWPRSMRDWARRTGRCSRRSRDVAREARRRDAPGPT